MQPDIYQYKSYLFIIAYNMLGDIAAAEDLVQDTFEKWLQRDGEQVKEVKAYLNRILINKAIDTLAGLKKQREAYKGWMPTPLLMQDNPPQEHTQEYALLFLLEKLNPYERAVFVLKEIFSFSHQQIATLLHITSDHCRQLFHQAKQKVRSPKNIRKHKLVSSKNCWRLFCRQCMRKILKSYRRFFWKILLCTRMGAAKWLLHLNL